MRLKWRALKTRSKIMLAVIAIVVVPLLLQHAAGRMLFWWECRTDEGAWVKPLEPAESLAYDLADSGGIKGCGGIRSYCMMGLTPRRDRYRFTEVFVHEPDPAYLSTETGWYRYWLAPANNPACTLFYTSAEAQANWLAVLSYLGPYTPPRF